MHTRVLFFDYPVLSDSYSFVLNLLPFLLARQKQVCLESESRIVKKLKHPEASLVQDLGLPWR
jgi:hypothetical protein